MPTYEIEPGDHSAEIRVFRVEDDGSRVQIYRGHDRRLEPTPRVSRYTFLGGRRGVFRRRGEKEGSFVDVYGGRLWLILLWVALMNAADSYFTLVHLQAGGIELNPVADMLLMTGRDSFVFGKSVLIALALVVLCVHKNFFLARLGILVSACAYTLLCVYHLSLFD